MKRDLQDIDPLASPAVAVRALPSADQAVLVDLLARIAQGEREAFRELYVHTSPRLLATARRLIGDASAAEDVVQETYLRVWRYSRSYRPEASAPMTWITQILRNRAIDLRAHGRKEEVPLPEEGEDGVAADLAGSMTPQSAPSDDLQVQACLERLDGLHRQVLSLAYHRGLSHAEIAAHLGVPLGTAKTWVRRALAALRSGMAAQGGGAPGTVLLDEDLAISSEDT